MLSIFSCVSWPSVCLLCRNVYLGLLLIFGLGCLFFWAAWAACIIWRLIFVRFFICKYFLPFWGLSFHFAYGFLCYAKLWSLIRSHLFIFVFIFITLGGGSKKILLWFMPKHVLPMPSSKSFIVSGLPFRSLIHFEFIFVYGVRECSNFIHLHVAVLFSHHHLLKRLSFLHCIFLTLHQR